MKTGPGVLELVYAVDLYFELERTGIVLSSRVSILVTRDFPRFSEDVGVRPKPRVLPRLFDGG
jgi:hypothetical protein